MSKDLERKTITEDTVEESEQDINALIDELTLFDDDLMGLVFDNNIPATQKVVSIILGRPIKVTKVKGQVELRSPELGGRKIRLDVKAVEANGDRINIEVQGDSAGSSVKRARYHSSMIDSRMLKKGQDFDEIKDSYVIFIYEHDKFKKGLPIYHLERFVEETGDKAHDGSHIIYVNGNYKGKDDIGKLIEDFKCKNSSQMHFKELADGVKYYKETEEGRDIVCEAVEKYGDKREARGKEKTKIKDVQNLMKNMKWTVEQALDALSIKGKERTKIIGKLQK